MRRALRTRSEGKPQTSDTNRGGIGIGLSICRDIVESHGGKLPRQPNKPSGTIFSFTLPVELQTGKTA
jgi:signal transduction histidine kinase